MWRKMRVSFLWGIVSKSVPDRLADTKLLGVTLPVPITFKHSARG